MRNKRIVNRISYWQKLHVYCMVDSLMHILKYKQNTIDVIDYSGNTVHLYKVTQHKKSNRYCDDIIYNV
jgi:hypothetical protein